MGMLLVLAVRKLLGLALAGVVVLLVVQGLGPALAADSLDRTTRAWSAAQAGRPGEAASLTDGLAQQWAALGAQVAKVRVSIERTVADLAGS